VADVNLMQDYLKSSRLTSYLIVSEHNI